MLDAQNIIALRMERQYLTVKANEKEYEELFRDMSPVPTIYWTEPGSPPSMYFRTDFDDVAFNNGRRKIRDIVKGRFQNGSIAYIEKDELDLFSALYRKPLTRFTQTQMEIIGLLESEGPMNIRLMKEMTGLLVKVITPALHKLQEACIVFEDQVDNEWDRGWYLFDREFPDIDPNRYTRSEALGIIMLRFAKLNVFFDTDMAKSFYKLPEKEIGAAILELLCDGALVKYNNGYMLKSDFDLLDNRDHDLARSVFVLHRNDYMVRSNEYLLKERYRQDDHDILDFILINGEFKGAVMGHFRFSDVPVEDIVLDMTKNEAEDWKNEILSALAKVIDPGKCPLKRYNGKEQN
jgi:hypothetical protein